MKKLLEEVGSLIPSLTANANGQQECASWKTNEHVRKNNKQMQVDCVQPDNILQICRQARLETAQTTFGKAGQKTTSPSDQRGESKTVSH